MTTWVHNILIWLTILTELLINEELAGTKAIVYYSFMHDKRPCKQYSAQSLSSLTLQEDEWLRHSKLIWFFLHWNWL